MTELGKPAARARQVAGDAQPRGWDSVADRVPQQAAGDFVRHDLPLLDVRVDHVALLAAGPVPLGAEKVTRREVDETVVSNELGAPAACAAARTPNQPSFAHTAWGRRAHMVPLPAPGPPRTKRTVGLEEPDAPKPAAFSSLVLPQSHAATPPVTVTEAVTASRPASPPAHALPSSAALLAAERRVAATELAHRVQRAHGTSRAAREIIIGGISKGTVRSTTRARRRGGRSEHAAAGCELPCIARMQCTAMCTPARLYRERPILTCSTAVYRSNLPDIVQVSRPLIGTFQHARCRARKMLVGHRPVAIFRTAT